jgi:uncharacterized protein (TIGR02118 family)
MSKTKTKRVGFVKRREDMTPEQFQRHWLTTHAELCKQLPGLRRYSVNLVDKSRFPHFDYDGFSELWFDDEPSLWASLESPQGKTLLGDLPNFAGQIHPIVSVETAMLGFADAGAAR